MDKIFSPAVCRWFSESVGVPTPAQREAWPVIAAGENALVHDAGHQQGHDAGNRHIPQQEQQGRRNIFFSAKGIGKKVIQFLHCRSGFSFRIL